MMSSLRSKAGLHRLAMAFAAAALYALAVSPAKADNISKTALFNQDNPSCNYAASRGGWHVISSSFKGFTEFTNPGSFIGAYVYLVYDPTVPEGFSFEDVVAQKRFLAQYYDEKSVYYLGRWPMYFYGSAVVKPDLTINQPMFSILFTMDRTTVMFVDPQTASPAQGALRKEVLPVIFAPPPTKQMLSMKIAKTPPEQFAALSDKLRYQRIAKVRGKRRLFNTLTLDPMVYSFQMPSFRRRWTQLRTIDNWKRLQLSDEFLALNGFFNKATIQGDPLFVGFSREGEWKTGARFRNFGAGLSLFSKGLEHFRGSFAEGKCTV